MKSAIALIFLGLVSVSSANAGDFACTANNGNRWQTANVGILAHGAQAIYHVSARGIYLTADLLCSYDGRCVGFTAGQIEIKGRLHFAKSGPHNVTGVSFVTKTSFIPDGHFSCL